MIRCPNCGAENKDDSRFCMNCGSPISEKPAGAAVPPVPPAAPPPPPPVPPPPRTREPDFMGLVGLAFLLFILGLVFAVNPRLGTEWARWSESMAQAGTLLRPPEGLIASAILFFNLTGISGMVVTALRVLSGKWRVRALADFLGAIGSFIFAFLLTFYQARGLTGQQVIAVEAAAMGLLLLIYIVVGIAWGLGRWAPRPEAQRPTPRP